VSAHGVWGRRQRLEPEVETDSLCEWSVQDWGGLCCAECGLAGFFGKRALKVGWEGVEHVYMTCACVS